MFLPTEFILFWTNYSVDVSAISNFLCVYQVSSKEYTTRLSIFKIGFIDKFAENKRN